MQNPLQSVAKDLVLSLKILENEPEKLPSLEREKYITNINRVFEMRLPLNEKLNEGIYWVIINCFTITKLEENEKLKLLELLKNLLSTLPPENSFIVKKKEQHKFTMLLISKLLEHFKHSAKQLVHLAVENIALLMEIVDKEFLIHCFPSLSNGLFKLLLQEFKCSSKTVQAAIAAIHTAYRRIFVYEENYSLQIFAKNHSVRQPVVSEKTGFVDLLTVRKNMNAIAKDEENKQLKDGIVKKNELEFYQKAHQNLSYYWRILARFVHKLKPKIGVATQFCNLIMFLLEKCSEFVLLFGMNELEPYLQIFFYECAVLESLKQPSQLPKLQGFHKLLRDPEFAKYVKKKALTSIADLVKLTKEVETEVYRSRIEELINYWKLAGANSMIVFTLDDLELLLSNLLAVFKFTFTTNLAIVQNNPKINFGGTTLKETIVNAITRYNWESYYANERNKLIAQLLPVTNFDDTILVKLESFFECISSSNLIPFMQVINAQFYLLDHNALDLERLASLTYLLDIMLHYSRKNRHKISFEVPFKLLLDSEIWAVLDEDDVEDTNRQGKMTLDLIDFLRCHALHTSYEALKETDKLTTILKNQYLICLLENFSSSGHLKKVTIHSALISFLVDINEAKTVAELISVHSSNIIQNITQKIGHLSLIRNKNSPFRMLVAFLEMALPQDFVRFVPSFVRSLNKFTDQYYLDDTTGSIEVALKLYLRTSEFLRQTIEADEKLVLDTLKTSNLLRQMLMRIKPFILSSDKKMSFYSIQILRSTFPVLAKLPMEREEVINFSTEDPENVNIPESLAPIAWEFFETLTYRMKKIEAVSLITECLKTLAVLNSLRPDFLHNQRRLEEKVFPLLQKLIDSKRRNEDLYSLADIRLLTEATDLLKAFVTYKERPVKEDFKGLMNRTLSTITEELKRNQEHYEKQISGELVKSLLEKIEQLTS